MNRETAAVRLLAGDKEPVRFKTTGNHTLAGLAAVNTDGITPLAGNRALVEVQTDATENGIYTASEGTWKRASDSNSTRTLIAGMKVHIQEGAVHAGQMWVLQTDRPNIGDDNIEWGLYLSTDTIAEIQAASVQFAAMANDIIAQALAATGAADYASRSVAAATTIPDGLTFIRTAGYYAAGDGGGGLYKKVALEPSHPLKFQSGANWYELVFVDDTICSAQAGGLRDGTDQTDALQACLDAVGVRVNPDTGLADSDIGGIVINNRGTKFNRMLLEFPKRSNLRFFTDDDLRQNPFTTRVTNEFVDFMANANDDGIVNERRIEAAYGPGLVVNVVHDATGHDAFTAPGANRVPTESTSAKTFFVMEADYVTQFSMISESFAELTTSKYNGTRFFAARKRVTVTVGTTAALVTAVGTRMYGLNAVTNAVEAIAHVVSHTATTVTLDWIFSQFQIGQELYDGAGGPYPLITDVTNVDVSDNKPMYFGHENPCISIGIAPGLGITDFLVAGRQMLTANVGSPWHTVEGVTNPALVFCANLGGAPSVGKQAVLNNSNQLVLVNGTANGTGSAAIGLIGSLGAKCGFNNSGSVGPPTDSFNVANVVRNASPAGNYTINYITNLLNGNSSVTWGLKSIADEVRFVSQTASSVTIQNYNRVTGIEANLTDLVFVTVTGGK
jgi:hypothetical protein